jgi:multidrug efflux pump
VISRFFIDRPIFAAVLSLVITLAGGIAVFFLPLAQFPQVAPPTVQVSCTYAGASAKEIADAVAAPIEQQVDGVEGMMYMSSTSANDGTYTLTVTFYPGIDLNMAQVLVQDRVNLAVPQLPDVIKQTGVSTIKRSPDILLGLAINSPSGRYDQLYLSNYVLMQIKDELARLPGVGDVFLFGERDYSMRVWVNPDKLSVRQLGAGDVVRAIVEQNQQVASGAIGQEPMAKGQQFQVPLSTLGRLKTVEQFGNMIIKTGKDGRVVRLRDVARLDLGAKNQDTSTKLDGRDTVFLAIFQMPDANALELRERVLKKMDELAKNFPDGVSYDIGFDTTPYTSESINEVVKTLRDAVILVAVVVLLFLQNWRSALIPLVAVPVAIVGTFAVMMAAGFSLNNLTLFGLVLAIGIVVDDAIVVVEAVEHHIEHGLAPREATIEAMRQVSGPVIAVGLVLSAVFVPCAFISGITGMFFRQFALTIASSTIISAFNSLTLSPALTALLLRPVNKAEAAPLPRVAFPLLGGFLAWMYLAPWLEAGVQWRGLPAWAEAVEPWLPAVLPWTAVALGISAGWLLSRPLNRLLGGFFLVFNFLVRATTAGYTRLVGGLLRVSVLVLLVYAGLLGVTYWRFQNTPQGFIPNQDMGYLFVTVQLPDSASMERTEQVMAEIGRIARGTPGVSHATTIAGMSFALGANGSNFGTCFLNLAPYPERRDPSLFSTAIAARVQMECVRKIPDALIMVLGPPPVRGVGRAGGFAIMIEDRGDLGPAELQAQVEKLAFLGPKLDRTGRPLGPDNPGMPALFGLFSSFRANVPQMRVEVNPSAAMMRGVNLQEFATTLTVYEGSLYVNDFNLFGRTWQVIVQAEPEFRRLPENLPSLRTRNVRGAMVPLGSLAEPREVNGPLVLTRYNMYPAATINGATAPGVSSGEGIALMKKLAEQELPRGMAYEWTDMSFLELLAGSTALVIFACAVVMVFLVLAAQYESWSLPLAVILVVPMCLLSAIIGVNVAAMDVNIFTQVGFVVLVGLASKNAILIVEFAKHKHEEDGLSRRDATLEACKLRLRPIIMTSLAFILGVLPLLLSTGAGAEMRRTLGTAVFAGMLGVTVFGVLLTPVFFFVIEWLSELPLFASAAVRHAGRWGLWAAVVVAAGVLGGLTGWLVNGALGSWWLSVRLVLWALLVLLFMALGVLLLLLGRFVRTARTRRLAVAASKSGQKKIGVGSGVN